MRLRVALGGMTVLGLALVLAACGGSNEAPGDNGAPADSAAGQGFVKLQGAGASFPAPLYGKWFRDYSDAHDNVQVDYQSVGSGSGIKAVINGTVDFGASDAAMKPDEIAQVPNGVVLLPMTAGSIVLAYNLEGIADLKLTREAYVGIFLGKITKWNDPLIHAANPDAALPDQPINVVVRADSSGTTYVFTKHLSAISEEFAASPGTNKMPDWPVGVASKGNEGVTGSIVSTPGSIGYIEYGYAKSQSKLAMASLENKSGSFVAPTIASAQSALASAEMPDDLILWISDPEGADNYPIVTYTWLLCYKAYEDPNKAQALKEIITYCLDAGQAESEGLGYIPLPANVIEKVKAAAENIS